MRIAGFGYNQAATDDAWRRVFAFFGEHLRNRSNGVGRGSDLDSSAPVVAALRRHGARLKSVVCLQKTLTG